MLWITAALLIAAGFGAWLYDLDVLCALFSLGGCAVGYAAMLRGLRGK